MKLMRRLRITIIHALEKERRSQPSLQSRNFTKYQGEALTLFGRDKKGNENGYLMSKAIENPEERM